MNRQAIALILIIASFMTGLWAACTQADPSDELTEASRQDPNHADAYVQRGMAYTRRGEYPQAIEVLTEAIRLDPDNAAAYAQRGAAYTGTREYTRAIADLTEAIRLKPTHVAAYAQRGVAYTRIGEYRRAIDDLTEAIRLDPAYVVLRPAIVPDRRISPPNTGRQAR